jgi:hypothetical protein
MSIEEYWKKDRAISTRRIRFIHGREVQKSEKDYRTKQTMMGMASTTVGQGHLSCLIAAPFGAVLSWISSSESIIFRVFVGNFNL